MDRSLWSLGYDGRHAYEKELEQLLGPPFRVTCDEDELRIRWETRIASGHFGSPMAYKKAIYDTDGNIKGYMD
jgi:hypothetical protein